MRALCLALILTAASPALAQSRPSTPTLPCARVAALVAAQRAIVLGTGAYSYDRYVSGGDQCQSNEYADAAWVPAADNPQCFVGYRCRNRGSLR